MLGTAYDKKSWPYSGRNDSTTRTSARRASWTRSSIAKVEIGKRGLELVQDSHLPLESLLEDVAFALEVLVERARARSQPSGHLDRADAGGFIAALGEEAHRRIEDALGSALGNRPVHPVQV